MDGDHHAKMTVLIQFGDNVTKALQPEREVIFPRTAPIFLPAILPVFAGF